MGLGMRRAAVIAIATVLWGAGAGHAEFPLTITDALGRAVTLARQPQRIVSLAPSVTEILFALDLDDRVVAVSDADDYPPDRVKGKPRVGGVAVNVEMVVGLRPDLILGIASLQRGLLDRLRSLQMPVVAVDAHDLGEVYAQIRTIGRLTDRDLMAQRLVSEMQARAATVAAAVHSRRPLRVYLELWAEPLIAAGGGTFMDDLIRRAGGTNILSDLVGWPQVAAETIIARNPEVIVVTYPGRIPVLRRRGWSAVAAVRSGRVAEMGSALVSRPGPRIVLGLEQLARILHPGVLP